MSVGMDVITGVQMLCISESVPVPEESYCWVLSSLEGLRETTGKGTCPGLAWGRCLIGAQILANTPNIKPAYYFYFFTKCVCENLPNEHILSL